jgi:AraC family transcriptional regulator
MLRIINDLNQHQLEQLPLGGNLINLSFVKQMEEKVTFRSFSIKYVVDGCEQYQVNGQRYSIKGGEYLLANTRCEGKVLVDSKHTVTGLCIDIAPDMLSEVTASLLRPDTPFPDKELAAFLHSEDFLENAYKTRHTHLGVLLDRMGATLPLQREACPLPQALFYELAEGIARDHIAIPGQMGRIGRMKSATRKELLRRTIQGKLFLDAHCTDRITIRTVAREVALSEYYFFRLFRSVYLISPYQYLLHKRLQYAHQLLRCNREISIAEVAIVTGFADTAAFSKAFKKYYCYPPSGIDSRSVLESTNSETG